MNDREFYSAGYQAGWHGKRHTCANAHYVRGHMDGIDDRRIHDLIQAQKSKNARQFWYNTLWLIFAAIIACLFLWGPTAQAMSRGGNVPMCQDLAALTRDIAQRRDEGFSPAAVMAIFAPSSDLVISTDDVSTATLQKETQMRELVLRATTTVYTQPEYSPQEVHDTVYARCIEHGEKQ
ncbi:MAG: hypothetical protein [Caudoviricetes sp.]|nr:MAG: hypothetical protein [Caudoviricetes sp.]